VEDYSEGDIHPVHVDVFPTGVLEMELDGPQGLLRAVQEVVVGDILVDDHEAVWNIHGDLLHNIVAERRQGVKGAEIWRGDIDVADGLQSDEVGVEGLTSVVEPHRRVYLQNIVRGVEVGGIKTLPIHVPYFLRHHLGVGEKFEAGSCSSTGDIERKRSGVPGDSKRDAEARLHIYVHG